MGVTLLGNEGRRGKIMNDYLALFLAHLIFTHCPQHELKKTFLENKFQLEIKLNCSNTFFYVYLRKLTQN